MSAPAKTARAGLSWVADMTNNIPPLERALLSVNDTCTVLSCGKKLFWETYAKRLEMVGTPRKRWVIVASIKRLVAEMQDRAAA